MEKLYFGMRDVVVVYIDEDYVNVRCMFRKRFVIYLCFIIYEMNCICLVS